MSELARLTFEILAHAWRKRDVLLVDLKIEFGGLAGGENQGQLVIADVIDNDSWRIWPQGREELMLDKQIYRNLRDRRRPERSISVKRAYERVADLVGTFPVMRPGMVAVIADAPAQVERANESSRRSGSSGCRPCATSRAPRRRRATCCSSLQQLEASFARLIFIAVGEDDLLRAMLDADVVVARARRTRCEPQRLRDAVREALGARRHRALRAHAADAGQRALGGAACGRVAAAAAAPQGATLALTGSPASSERRAARRRTASAIARAARARTDDRRAARVRCAVERALQL